MSRTIDERVVEMRFDNKQFESATSQTLGTLQKLKEALNFSKSADSLKGLEKSVSDVRLDGIAAGVAALEKRFSVMGIVGMQVIKNITNALTNTLGKGINFVNDAIIGGGIKRAMNLENAHFQLQSLLKDEVRVQEVMDSASRSVDGTAYSFDVAAKAASQFTASGITNVESLDTALAALAGTTATYNADYEQMAMIFTQVAGQGRLMGDQLLQLSTRGANAAVTIADYMNAVNSGSVEVSDSVKAAVQAVSTQTDLTEGEIRDFVSKSKINFDIFAAAMDHAFGDSAARANETFNGALANVRAAFARIGAGFVSPLIEQNSEIVKLFNAIRLQVNEVKKSLVFDESIGNVNALSKQFTDAVLSMAKSATQFVNNMDLTKPLSVFYYGVKSTTNVLGFLLSVLKPVASAFKEVFLTFSGDDVINLARNFEKLTSNLKLSDKASKNLQDAFKGVFNVGKMLLEVCLKLIKALVPMESPVNGLGDALLSLVGSIGRSLTAFSEWVRSSETVKKAFDMVGAAAQTVIGIIGNLISSVVEFVSKIGESSIIQSIFETIAALASTVGEIAGPAFEFLVEKLKDFGEVIGKFALDKLEDGLKLVTEGFEKFKETIESIKTEKVSDIFDKLLKSVQGIGDLIKHNGAIATFTESVSDYFSRLRSAMGVDDLIDKLSIVQGIFNEFVTWMKNLMSPLAEGGITLGGVISAITGVGIMYEIDKLSKAFQSLTSPINAVTGLLGTIKSTLVAYQEQIKAQTLVAIAAAIGILVASLVALSFVDPERLLGAAMAMAGVAAVLLIGMTKLTEAAKKSKELSDVLNTAAKYLGRALNNFAKAAKWKQIANTLKSFGLAITMIAGSMIALALMYSKDKNSLMGAAGIVAAIAGVLSAMMVVFAGLGDLLEDGASNMQKAATGVLILAAAVALTVASLAKLFAIDLPDDWKAKMAILSGIFVGLGALSMLMSLAGRLLNGGDQVSATAILASAASMTLVVMALKKLFELELPDDMTAKLALLAGCMVGLAAVAVAIGKAGATASSALGMSATILSMCVLMGAIVLSLMVLKDIPFTKLISGAVSLGIVLVALGAALYGAGKISEKDTYKSVFAMAANVGVITASLGVLSMIKWTALAKGVIALDAVLMGLAVTFSAIGKINNDNAYLSVVAMIAQVLIITYSLGTLATQPWDSLLAASASLSIVLLAMSKVFETIGETEGIDLKKIGLYLTATLTIVPIGVALYTLSTQPWEGLLAAGVAITLVLTAFIGVFAIVSNANPNVAAMGTFLLATVALLPITLALKELANEPWEGLLAAAGAISAVLLVMVTVLAACTLIGAVAPAALAGIALLDLAIANLVAVFAILGELSKMEGFMEAIRGGYGFLGEMADAIGAFFGGIVKSAITTAAEALPILGEQLSEFMNGAKPFFEAINGIDESAMVGVNNLAQAVLTLTASNILNGLTSWLTGGTSLVKFGEELAEFGPLFSKYCDSIANVDGGAVQASASAAEVMANLATKLPASGGLVQKILGEKHLSEFGAELALFGPYLASYSQSVVNVDPAVVKTSADAAQIMADMNKTLPNSGGLVEKIFGAKHLSEFGAELALFGPYLSSYAASVKNLDPGVVQASANAASAMSELANKLPNTGGLVAFFTGDNDIAAFGRSLSAFGNSFYAYYQSISQISPVALATIATEFERLVNIAKGVSDVDTSGMSRFSMDLTNLGRAGIDEFIKGFENANDRVTQAVNKLIEFMASGINSNIGKLNKSGEACVSAISKSINSSKVQTEMKTVGAWVPKSLAVGMTESISFVTNAAIKVGRAINETIADTIDVHSLSPSKVEKGKWVGKSLGVGMEESIPGLVKSAEKVGNAINNGVDMDTVFSAYGGIGGVKNQITNMFGNIAGAMSEGGDEIAKVDEGVTNEMAAQSGKRQKIQNDRVVAEQGFWEALLAAKRTGAEAEKYMEMDVAEFQKQTLSDVVDTLKDYADQMQSARDSLMGSLDLFSEIGEKEAKNKYELQANLQSQIREYENYTETLTSLNERLGDSALGDYLRTLSVDSLAQLEVLNEMTDEELQTYSGLYDTRMAAATEAASAQLYGLRQETESKLSEIFGTMSNQVNLYDFAQVFDGSIQSIEKYVTDLNEKFNTFNQDAQTLGAAFPENLSAGVEGAMDTFVGSVGTAIGTALQTIGAEQGTAATDAGKEIGTNLDAGVGAGMTESTVAQESATQLMDAVLNALTSAGEIHSPSLRTNREVGVPLVQGIGQALVETTEPLITGATALAETLINAITSSVSDRFSDITGNMKDLATTIATGIKNNLPQSDIQNSGAKVVEWIIGGIKSKDNDLLTKVKNTCEEAVRKFKTSLIESDFKPNGVNIITWIMQGIESMFGPLEGIIQTVCNNIVEWLEEKLDLDRIKAAGASVVTAIKAGIEELIGPLGDTCRTIGNTVISTLSGILTYEAGYSIGANFSRGLSAGIASRKSSGGDDDDDPVDAAEDLGEDISSELENDLEISSPSKRAFRYGVFFVKGLALGIKKAAVEARKVSSEMAEGTVSVFNDAVRKAYEYIENSDIDTEPTITPRVDLSEVRRGAMDISNILSDTYNLSTRSRIQGVASVIASARKEAQEIKDQKETNAPTEQKFEFIQNNYSPKALSRSDIYRQTNNQFTAFKNAVSMA